MKTASRFQAKENPDSEEPGWICWHAQQDLNLQPPAPQWLSTIDPTCPVLTGYVRKSQPTNELPAICRPVSSNFGHA